MKKKLLPVILTLVVLFTFTLAAASPGVVADIGFEIDGNIELDINGIYDWENAPDSLIPDKFGNADLNIFKPAGKFAEPWNWSILPGNVGSSQSELTNVFVWAVPKGEINNADTWIVMGMERLKKEGTFALDFEFNQKSWDGTSKSLVRTTGDVVVGFELKGNPTSATEDLKVLIIVYDNTGVAQPDCYVKIGNGNKLEGVIYKTGQAAPAGYTVQACPSYGAGFFYRYLESAAVLGVLGEATMNETGFAAPKDVPPGYISYDSQGKQDNTVGPFEFAEAAINLTKLGLDPGCPGFGTVHAKTRSSLEVTSDLKDLAGPKALPVQCYIEGYKYLDVNGNGDRDANEPALEGWEIRLSGAATGTTYTDANGYYKFEDLANGAYTVSEVCPTADPAWVQTEPGLFANDDCGDEVHSITLNLANRVAVGDFGNGAPDIAVEKTCPVIVEAGQSIPYTFTTTNTGNVNLVNVSLTDPLIVTPAVDLGSLLPGAFTVYNKSITAPASQTLINTASVSGDFGSTTVYATVQASDSCTTEVVNASITVAPSAVNEVNSPHIFTFTVTANPAGAALKSVSITPNISGGTVAANTCASPVINGNVATCTVTVNSSAVATISASASANITFTKAGTDLTITRTTNGVSPNSGPATKYYVDANIQIAPSDVNEIGQPHVFTITASALVPTGYAGTVALSALAPCDAGTTVFNAATNVATCTYTASSNVVDTLVQNASATFLFNYGITTNLAVTRTTNGTGGNSGPATKHWVDANISISPSAVNEIGQAHQFTLTANALVPAGYNGLVELGTLAPCDAGTTVFNAATNVATCTYTVSSNVVDTLVQNASVTFLFTYGASTDLPVTRTTNGTGGNSGPATKHWVDANISISPSAVNEVGTNHVFTITASALVPAQYSGTVTLDTLAPCDTGSLSFNAATKIATCTYTVNSAVPHTFTVHANVQFSFGFAGSTATLTRTTDGIGDNSGPAVKHYVDANVQITPSDVNEVGVAHVFTITASALVPAGYDGTVNLTSLTPCDAPPVKSGTTWTCTHTVNSSTVKTFTVNADAAFSFGYAGTTAALTRTTDGTGTNSGPAIKYYVDGKVEVAPSETNGITEAHTFTITATAYPGEAVFNSVVLTYLLSDASKLVSDTCATPVVSGTVATCDVVVNSSVAASVNINATAVFTFGGPNSTQTTVTRTTNGSETVSGSGIFNSGPATKTWVAASLFWIKHDQFGQLLGGATFEVCRTHDRFGNDITDACVTVLDDSTLDQDKTPGEFLLTGLIFGTYTLEETIAPDGYKLDPTVVTVTVNDLSNPYVDVSLIYIWVNTSGRAQLTPTNIECDAFYGGTAPDLVLTANSSGNIAPGRFFYYNLFQPSADSNLKVITYSDPDAAADPVADAVKVWIIQNGVCVNVTKDTTVSIVNNEAFIFVPQAVANRSVDQQVIFRVEYAPPSYYGVPTTFYFKTYLDNVLLLERWATVTLQ